MNLRRGLFRATVVGCVFVGAVFTLFAPKPTLEDFRWRPPTEVEKANAKQCST